MIDIAALHRLKEGLPRTWLPFFEVHGSFTAAQVAAIPALLDGANIVLCAPTASGKTAAAIAPLIERHCPVVRQPALRILYFTPTRALANDLYTRLQHPFQTLQLGLASKTRDSSFAPAAPPDLLISTPESVDSLLTSHAGVFRYLRAIIIDELHLFDGTPRGDQLRAILNRIRRICAYALECGDRADATIQYAALSATLTEPQTIAARYFPNAQAIQVPGGRMIESTHITLDPDTSNQLLEYIGSFRALGYRKALVFCNSRAEVEAYASATLASSPFGNAVYAHYSNLTTQRRREIEQQFAAAQAAICFASSTLELGIDIGTIDVVILIGPPGNLNSFLQRIGRSNRRGPTIRLTCCSRTLLERALFDILLGLQQDATADQPIFPAPFRPSVLVQQIFSMIKQSPTAALRLAELSDLFGDLLARSDIEAILAHLLQRDYLSIGRPGEWRAGPRLNKLFDEQNTAQPELSIYTNIRSDDRAMIAIRDQQTQQTLAHVDATWLGRDLLTLEGRPINVEWYDGEALWVNVQRSPKIAQRLVFRSARQLLSYELARQLPSQFGLLPGTAPYIAAPSGWWWFHWLGDVYGRALLDLLHYHVPSSPTSAIGLAVQLPDQLVILPEWPEHQVVHYLRDSYRQYESLLELGPFQSLLPISLRRRAVVEQFNVPRFLSAVADLHPSVALESLTEDLARLLH